jgi:hypothetical protein
MGGEGRVSYGLKVSLPCCEGGQQALCHVLSAVEGCCCRRGSHLRHPSLPRPPGSQLQAGVFLRSNGSKRRGCMSNLGARRLRG